MMDLIQRKGVAAMIVASQLRNKIPLILKQRGLSISDLQRKTGLSYPATHNIARDEALVLSDETRIGTIRVICEALGISLSEAVEVEILPEG